MNDGVYFGMSEQEYFGIPALGSTDLKNLLISLPDFWVGSFLNKNKREDERETEAKIIGRAFHKRILEGKTAFYKCYAPKFADDGTMLKTVDELKEECTRLDIDFRKYKNKNGLIDIYLMNGGTKKIFDVEKSSHETLHKGKILLSEDLIYSIEVANAMIENSPTAGKCFKGGYPEVVVVWSKDGVRYKARFDYLKPAAICDLKTFSNVMNKGIESAIYSDMAKYKRHIQAVHYLNAVDEAKRLVKEGLVGACSDPESLKPFPIPPPEWLEEFVSTEEHSFYFVWQKKGDAPLARVMKFPRTNMYQVGQRQIEEASIRYQQGLEKFGEEQWIDDTEIKELVDGEYPVYAMEI